MKHALRQQGKLTRHRTFGERLDHGLSQLLRHRDLPAFLEGGDYGQLHCISEVAHPPVLIGQVPPVNDKPRHSEPPFFKIPDAPEDVVGRVRGHEFARCHDVDEIGVLFPQGDREPAADHVAKHVVKGHVVAVGADAQGFEKVEGAQDAP